MSDLAASHTAAEPPVAFFLKEDYHPQNGTLLGFWLYLMSDCLIFASLFATYAVLGRHYAGGPTGAQLFDLSETAFSTALLLLSSITSGVAMLKVHANQRSAALFWLLITAALGVGFVGLEIREFAHMVVEGASPGRSAFLTTFFALVGTHGLHVSIGILWMIVLMAQVGQHGLIDDNKRRLMCLSLFWHFLDIVWIGVFTFVYLMGSMP